MDRIGLVGTSYRTTAIEHVAAAALPRDFPPDALVDLARFAGFSELVYLGTCNRVEFYYRADTTLDNQTLLFHLRHSLAALTDGACQLPSDEQLYVLKGQEAVQHLFRVTAALDSMMVGEAQIAGQAKAAHELAHELGLLSGILDQTFHEAFHLAKRVRSETDLARRPVSLVTLVERTLHEHLAATSAPVLILGAGEMAQQTLRLIRSGDRERRVLVANRTVATAEAMVAADHAAGALPLESVQLEPPRVSLIVAATSSEEPIFTADHLRAIRARLPADEQLLAVDLALPPNIDPRCAELPGVSVHGIEAMRAEADRNRELRLAEMSECEKLVDHQILILRRRLHDRALSPAAKELHRSFQEMTARVLNHALSKDLAHLGDDDRAAVERMAQGLIKRLVQVPLRGLKGAAWNGSTEVIDHFVRGLDEGVGSFEEKP